MVHEPVLVILNNLHNGNNIYRAAAVMAAVDRHLLGSAAIKAFLKDRDKFVRAISREALAKYEMQKQPQRGGLR